MSDNLRSTNTAAASSRFLRRYIPTLRLGTVALDLSFMVLFLVVFVLFQAVQLI